MNVYDFDGTICAGDCEDRFFAYLFRKKGFYKAYISFLWNELLFRCKLRSRTECREREYRVLRQIKDLDALLEDYWDQTEKYMLPWYAAVQKPDDVIATSTPGFLMEPMMRRLGIQNLVATKMDKRTGKIDGLFGEGEEKRKNFCEKFDPNEIDSFYSDTYSDRFMASCAKRAYVVRGNGNLTEWDAFFQIRRKR